MYPNNGSIPVEDIEDITWLQCVLSEVATGGVL